MSVWLLSRIMINLGNQPKRFPTAWLFSSATRKSWLRNGECSLLRAFHSSGFTDAREVMISGLYAGGDIVNEYVFNVPTVFIVINKFQLDAKFNYFMSLDRARSWNHDFKQLLEYSANRVTYLLARNNPVAMVPAKPVIPRVSVKPRLFCHAEIGVSR